MAFARAALEVHVDGRDRDLALRVERCGEPGTRTGRRPARREMGDAIDHAGTIGDRDEHPVLDRARRHDVVGEPRDLGRPVHRHGDDVGTSERECATHLGEAEVVTDRHAEPTEGEVEHGAQPIARHDESIGTEDRQMGLAHVVHRTVGAEHRGGVVQRIAGALEKSDDHGDAASDGGPRELVETRIVTIDRSREGGVAGRVPVAGERALGEHDELRARRRRPPRAQHDTRAALPSTAPFVDLELRDREPGRTTHHR